MIGNEKEKMQEIGKQLETHRHAIHWIITDMRNGHVTKRQRARVRLTKMRKVIDEALALIGE